MWIVDLPELDALTPIEQLWVIAQAVEENDGPADYVRRLRRLADWLDAFSWWLAEPAATESPAGMDPTTS